MSGPTNPAEYSDALKSMLSHVRMVPKSESPEVVLMLRSHFEQLNRMCGLPVEVFDSEYEQEQRALELAESGKRCLVCK